MEKKEISSFSSTMKAYIFRLLPGQDLYPCLNAYIKENNIEAACILTCVGSLRQIHIRTAAGPKERFIKKEQFYEITSLTGCVSKERNHLHISLGDNEGNGFGGHLMQEGNIVYTTAEIVLGVFEQLRFEAEICDKSGWDELVIKNK